MVARISCGVMCYRCVFRGPAIHQFLIALEAAWLLLRAKSAYQKGKPRTSNIADDMNSRVHVGRQKLLRLLPRRVGERNCSLRIICSSIWNHFYESAERFNDDNYKRGLSSAQWIPVFSEIASWTMKSNGTIVNISTISWEKRWYSSAQMEVLSAKAWYNSFGEISDVKASNHNWKNWSLSYIFYYSIIILLLHDVIHDITEISERTGVI